MQLELELQPRGAHALLLASSPEAAWDGATRDWFTRAAAEAWKSQRGAVVVVPTRGQIQALKQRLLEAGLSALGLQFVTPPYLRALLGAQSESLPPAREHLRLLLALASEQLLADTTLPEAERLAAISVRRTPDHLLRLIEQLSAAGSDFQDVDLPAFRPVVRKFRAHLKATQFEIFPESDRRALAHAGRAAPALGKLLITGFHGGHWPLWNLLRAALQSSQSATVILQNPRDEAHDLDSAWIGNWEEVLREAQLVALDRDPPVQARPPSFWRAWTRQNSPKRSLRRRISSRRRTLHAPWHRFSSGWALSRLVAAALTRQGLPHYDAMGQIAPGLFEAPDFWSWMELQRTPRLTLLLRFLTSLPNDQSFLQDPSRDKIDRALHRALADVAIDDLPSLNRCGTRPRRRRTHFCRFGKCRLPAR